MPELVPGRLDAATTINNMAAEILGTSLPVRIRAWDGSEAGPSDGPLVVLRNRRALRHFLWSPGQLGLARAFVSGDLVVDGDLADGLRRCWAAANQHRFSGVKISFRQWLEMARAALRLGAIGPRPPIPHGEARLSGVLHSLKRDQTAIAHHYDVSNAFYELLLDPSMAYSCGYFVSGADDLESAQEAKLDLICRKLNLRPGMRLLDVGCGWGSLVLFAAQRYHVHTTGVTLSREQYDHVRRRIDQFGLHGQVEVRLQDYREITDEPFDVISSIEMGEHVGEKNYAEFAAQLFRLLRPSGRLLIQQMSRGGVTPGGGAFIESYIAPDMSMVPVGRTLEHLEGAGFEIRDVEAMREHYVRTVAAWIRTLDEQRDEAVRILGEQQYRVWQLYLAGGMLTFEANRMGVNQIVAARTTAEGASGVPAVLREAVACDSP